MRQALLAATVTSALAALSGSTVAVPPRPSAAGPSPAGVAQRFEYDYATEAAVAARIDVDAPDPDLLRRIFAVRRQRVLDSMETGAMLIYAVERSQERRLEFQVPHSDNHDFIYLTGLDGLDALDSALLLIPPPGAARSAHDVPNAARTVLFTSGEPAALAARSGIEDVRPMAQLEQELSVAMTDFRDWRVTQVRRWPLAAALAKRWGNAHKVLHLNYPRFFRLGMAEPPRLEIFDRLQRFSPELEVHDAADLLDVVRMRHDAWSLANLRRAIEITGEGIVEALRAARPGVTEKQVMEIMDFVYRYRGATLGFPTSVRRQFSGARAVTRTVPEGWIEFVPRSGGEAFRAGDMLHTDTGAAFNHYSADIQRNLPIDGTFTPEQARLYDIALAVQKSVISMVRPGVSWWQLHDHAVAMLRDAGGYDAFYTYGIGHFIGMEVHDEGDYLVPLQAGMVLSIEQGVAPPDGPRVAFEDDVLVTEDGFQWLSRVIPIERAEIVALAAAPSSFDAFVGKRPLEGLLEAPRQ